MTFCQSVRAITLIMYIRDYANYIYLGEVRLTVFSTVGYSSNPSRVAVIATDDGAVAQLGERMTGSHEVRGSIPLGSTNPIKHLQQ